MSGITVVIPVRSGSQRVKNKNIRKFSYSNLLELKIKEVLKVPNISEIIISSDSDKMLEIGKKFNIKTHKRDNYFASSECPNYEYWIYLAKNVGNLNNDLLMLNVVSPFVNANKISELIDIYKKLPMKYNGMTTVKEMKKFFWDLNEENPINYNINESPNSQLLKPIGEITFAVSISSRKNIINSGCIFGKNPFLYKLNSLESIDIDTKEEFLFANFLHKNNINQIENLDKMLIENPLKTITLDCTIRDGGYTNNWEFLDEEVIDCYKAVSQADFDYFEIGFRSNKNLLKDKGKWCYSTDDNINNIKNEYTNGCKIAVMAKIGTVLIDDFDYQKNTNIDLVRVLIPRCTLINNMKVSIMGENLIDEAITFCKELKEKGYEICLNLACGDLLTFEELDMIICKSKGLELKSIYLADTYGSFTNFSIKKQFDILKDLMIKYNNFVNLGFHSHNNMLDALNKSLFAVEEGALFIDSCINGLGRGAGNLPSETLILSLKNDPSLVIPIAKYAEKYILKQKDYLTKEKVYGYNILYVLAGRISLHPDYVKEIIKIDLPIEKKCEILIKINKFTKLTNQENFVKEILENEIKNI